MQHERAKYALTADSPSCIPPCVTNLQFVLSVVGGVFMHMADALLSPAVGGVMWAGSAGTIAYCSARLGREADDRKVPLMGVMGAFLFAAQMINFAIPGTGSSGHLGGGVLLAILLGPSAAFLTIASVLVVQALFFADGGLLALGCNIFNIAFLPSFVVYPLCYARLAGGSPSRPRFVAATVFSAVLALQLGSLAVVLETICSGVSSLPFATFASLMQPIHLAIGMVEGAATVAILSFVLKARPDLLEREPRAGARRSLGAVPAVVLAGALITASVLSLYASQDPDGLEWAVQKAAGGIEAVRGGGHGVLAELQEKVAWFPDYGAPGSAAAQAAAGARETSGVNGTSLAGTVGTVTTLALVLAVGFLLRKRNQTAG